MQIEQLTLFPRDTTVADKLAAFRAERARREEKEKEKDKDKDKD